jgi:hypothetical protein
MRTSGYLAGAALAMLLGLGATLPARASAGSLAGYFPAKGAYGPNYSLLSVRSYTRDEMIFSGDNVALANRSGFVTGATRVALGPHVVVTVTLARFRDAQGATRFSRSFQTDVLKDGKQSTALYRRLGVDGARSVSGACASCGDTAPTLLQVYLHRGPVFVVVGVEPSNHALGLRLVEVIDGKLNHEPVR